MKLWIALSLLLSMTAVQSTPQQRIYLELSNTKITENGEVVIDVGGKCGAGEVLAFHLPRKGWFVASVHSVAGYDFRKVGKLVGNKITFKMDDRRYEIISDQPISSQLRSLDLWIVRITPPADEAQAGSKVINCSTDFNYWLKTILRRDESNKPVTPGV